MATLPHSAQRTHALLLKTKEKVNSKKWTPRKKVALGLLHQILGHRSTISLMAVYTENAWKDT